MRKGLGTLDLAASSKVRGTAAAAAADKGALTTSMILPRSTYQLLRLVALKRAAAGGRMSISAVLVDLVEKNRATLEREAKE